jgi:tetratricopeptide (TPR) repeat protein
MFFPRLRRQAKWVFVLLVLVFTLGFVIFGVGSGGGIGLGDLFNSNNNSKASVSETDARKRIQKNSKDAQAYRDLATALETKGDLTGAVAALRHFTKLRPQNVDALTDLAGLYTAEGSRLQPQIQTAQAGTNGTLDAAFNAGIHFNGQEAVSPNPIFTAVSAVRNNRLTELYTSQQKDFTNAEVVYEQIVKISPKDATAQLNLGQVAQQAGDTTAAIAAYQRFIQLAPDDPTTPIVKQQIKQLRQAANPSANVSGG